MFLLPEKTRGVLAHAPGENDLLLTRRWDFGGPRPSRSGRRRRMRSRSLRARSRRTCPAGTPWAASPSPAAPSRSAGAPGGPAGLVLPSTRRVVEDALDHRPDLGRGVGPAGDRDCGVGIPRDHGDPKRNAHGHATEETHA